MWICREKNGGTGYELQKYISPVAFKPDFYFGSDVMGIGFDISVGTPTISPISYRVHYGATRYSRYYDNAFLGVETRSGGEWSVSAINFGSILPINITFSGTRYSSGNISQTTNKMSIGDWAVNVNYENDYMFNIKLPGVPAADNGDRWRTAAVQINAGPLSLGTNIMTGDPGFGIKRKYIEGSGIHAGKYVYNGEHANDYRFGSFYVGIEPFRFGSNNERNRHIFQNKFAHDRLMGGSPKHFQFMYDRPWRRYWYFGTGTGNSLW